MRIILFFLSLSSFWKLISLFFLNLFVFFCSIFFSLIFLNFYWLKENHRLHHLHWLEIINWCWKKKKCPTKTWPDHYRLTKHSLHWRGVGEGGDGIRKRVICYKFHFEVKTISYRLSWIRWNTIEEKALSSSHITGQNSSIGQNKTKTKKQRKKQKRKNIEKQKKPGREKKQRKQNKKKKMPRRRATPLLIC